MRRILEMVKITTKWWHAYLMSHGAARFRIIPIKRDAVDRDL